MGSRIPRFMLGIVVLSLLATLGWGFVKPWWSDSPSAVDETTAEPPLAPATVQPVRLTPQAQRNLQLVSKPLKVTTFWRMIDIPGVVIDRPGISDRGVVAPVAGVITRIYHYPGDTVEPSAPLFAVRLVSESLHASQLELFKATREMEIAEQQRQRLNEIAQSGALAQARIIEIDNQIARLEVNVEAYTQDLQARGMAKDLIAAVAGGKFLTTFVVKAPGPEAQRVAEVALASAVEPVSGELPFAFELQDLNVEIGEQVDAGQMLCKLADHRSLLIEGHGFKEDMPWIQEAAKNGWEVEVEFGATTDGDWPELPAKLPIHHVANSIDAATRTFNFYLSLDNQRQAYTQDGQVRLIWRFRPGDRVHLHAAVETFEDVFVLPQQAIVRAGPEAFVFRHNGEFFDRISVHVLYEDRRHVVLANDGSVRAGFYFAQNAAASINRVMKAQAASGAPANVHVHPDGTIHAAH